MANEDSAQYTLRYNEISGSLEAKVGLNWVEIETGGSGVVPRSDFQSDDTLLTTASLTYVAAGPSATLAVQNAANKVRLSFCAPVSLGDGTNTMVVTIMVDGVTDVATPNALTNFGGGASTDVPPGTPICGEFVYTPGDTSSHTYQVYIKSNGGTQIYYCISGSSADPLATMSVEEIIV